jgi:heme exporter protein A
MDRTSMQLANRPERAPETAALVVDDLNFKTGFISVLRNIHFELRTGELLLLIGPNGAGKSTLLKCLAGLLPHGGKKQIFGASLNRNYDLRKKIGYLGHESFLYSKFSARENIAFYSDLYQSKVDVQAILQEYELVEFREQLVETFSRGMKQKLSLARALLNDPQLVFLDEPFTGLDQAASALLHHQISRLKSKAAIVLTTHELEQGYELCDKVLILKAGRQAFFGSKNEVNGSIRHFYNERIL